MQILLTRILSGPNIYSYKPVLWIKVALGKYEDIPSTAIAGFVERLLLLLPSLQEHHCARGRAGGFVERLHEGTYFAHIFEHVILELQSQAGYQVGFGKARSSTQAGVYDVVVGFQCQAAAQASADAALRLLMAAAENQPFKVDKAIDEIRAASRAFQLGPSTQAVFDAAKSRGIPVRRLDDENLLILGYGRFCQRIWATLTEKTSVLASDLASDKFLTAKVLTNGGIAVPRHMIVRSKQAALEAMTQLEGAVVVKPLSGNHGKGVTVDIDTVAELERAYDIACQYDEDVLIEAYIPGRQYRLCVVNGRLVAAAERIPAYVIGDGQHTVEQLVALTNQHPDRGDGHANVLTKIEIDPVAATVLAKQNLSVDSIPALERVVRIRDCANLSTGGTAVDVTAIVHPDHIRTAERAARLVGLDVAGIDLAALDITAPGSRSNGVVIEVNAAPGIRMHHHPTAGQSRDVAGAIVDYLFPDGHMGRIPITAITGTNGKTTVTRMIGHIWQQAGYRVGMTTTEGIFINGRCIMDGDTTGPNSAKIVLADDQVDVAVLETARGGIVRGGLAFDKCDVGIVTNITEDHLGQDGIESLEDLAHIKSLVLETVKTDGVALINADDPYAAALAARVQSEIMYFSIEPNNIVVRRHLGAGGKAAFVKDGIVYLACGALARPIVAVNSIPTTLGGVALHNLQNAVIAAAACYCSRLPVSYIKQGLSSFAQNPGRLTMMDVGDFQVCIDYGHNPAGYQALINTARRMNVRRLVGVIGAPGDRREDVTLNIGKIAGQGFDYLYIKEDLDLRGRNAGETAELLKRGILATGFSPSCIDVILSEEQAVAKALENSQAGDLVIVFYENYDVVIQAIEWFAARIPAAVETRRPPVEIEQAVVAAAVKNI